MCLLNKQMCLQASLPMGELAMKISRWDCLVCHLPLASLSNGNLDNILILPWPLQSLLPASLGPFPVGPWAIQSEPPNRKGSLKVWPVLDTDLGAKGSFKFCLLCKATFLFGMKEKSCTGWWGVGCPLEKAEHGACSTEGTGGHQFTYRSRQQWPWFPMSTLLWSISLCKGHCSQSTWTLTATWELSSRRNWCGCLKASSLKSGGLDSLERSQEALVRKSYKLRSCGCSQLVLEPRSKGDAERPTG